MLSSKKILVLLALILSIHYSILAREPIDTLKRIEPLIEFKEDIIKLIRESKTDNALLGISIKSIDQNQVIFNINDNKNLVPASLQKLLTTATALRYLGENYKFQTEVYFDGKINSLGTFKGNIIIKGYGDPTHSELFDKYRKNNFFDFFISILDSFGIKEIQGNIIGDDNFFDNEYYPIGWQYDDLNYSYASQISALSVNRNSFTLTIFSNKNDTISQIAHKPNLDYIQIENQLKNTDEETDIKIIRELGTNVYKISGHISKNLKAPIKLEIAIDNPTLYFLNLVKYYLKENFIDFKGLLLDIDDLDFLPDYDNIDDFYVYYSPELKYIINEINTQSLNLESEMLLKTIGREVLGFGSTQNGLDVIKMFLNKLKVDESSIKMTDGSGLSRLNYYSCQLIQRLLEYETSTSYFKIFLNSLARPGEEGTLKYRMQKSAAKNLVFAKTGTMTGISNIAGYVYSRDKELFSFVIMVMNHTENLSKIHDLQNLIIMRLSAFTRYPEYYRFKE